MPLFEYRCKDCGSRFTLLVGVTAEKAKRCCPKCGCTRATKLISRIAPIARSEDEFDDTDFDDSGEDVGEDYSDDWDEE